MVVQANSHGLLRLRESFHGIIGELFLGPIIYVRWISYPRNYPICLQVIWYLSDTIARISPKHGSAPFSPLGLRIMFTRCHKYRTVHT